MRRTKSILFNIIFFLQVLLVFLLLFEDRVQLPTWLQVVGRLHPVVLHLPIGLLIFFAVLLLIRSQFKKKIFGRIGLITLLITSLSASFTALFGFFLSQQGDYGEEALSNHRIGGITLSFLCYGLLVLFDYSRKPSPPVYWLSLLATISLFFAGHTGGTLTHGENYLLAPLNGGARELASDESASIFQRAVYPVLDRKCVSCHNQAKAKGKFVMTSIPEFKKGGKEGKEWEEGKPGQSRLIRNIHLPLEDDNHMPPDGKPQLTHQEISLLEQWIKSGADFEKKMSDLGEGDSLRIIASAILTTRISQDEEKLYQFSAAPEDVVKKLNTPFRALFPLYRNSPALQADFFIKESFQARMLEELTEVKGQLVVMNLSKMPVTDQELSIIANFKNLERLNLNYSQVKGTGLSSLKSLTSLISISLAGTDIESESMKPLLQLPALRELFVWNTRITEEQRIALANQYPKLLVVTTQFKDDKVLRLGRPVLELEGVVKSGEPIVLRHSMPGVTIRYTLDGSTPDSLASPTYSGPVKLVRTSKLKAIACKPGWNCSDVFEMTCFLEGQTPLRSELLTKTESFYPGEGSKSLSDGVKGFIEVLNTPAWLGYKERPLIAVFEFGKPVKITSVVISYAKNLGGSIFPPLEVEVWGGKNQKDVRLIKTERIEQPKASQPAQVEALSIPVTANYSFYKLVAKPVGKLPKWHASKGKKGWLLIDEVILN